MSLIFSVRTGVLYARCCHFCEAAFVSSPSMETLELFFSVCPRARQAGWRGGKWRRLCPMLACLSSVSEFLLFMATACLHTGFFRLLVAKTLSGDISFSKLLLLLLAVRSGFFYLRSSILVLTKAFFFFFYYCCFCLIKTSCSGLLVYGKSTPFCQQGFCRARAISARNDHFSYRRVDWRLLVVQLRAQRLFRRVTFCVV